MFRAIFPLRAAIAGLFIAGLVACSPTYQNHGYVPPAEDLNQLVVGVDTRGTVDDVIGAPTASGMMGDGDYYYVRSRMKQFGPKRAEEIERQVVAISFDQNDVIANIETFGLRDGMVVQLTRRVTDSSVGGKGFLRQMMGNLGNLDPSEFF